MIQEERLYCRDENGKGEITIERREGIPLTWQSCKVEVPGSIAVGLGVL